VAARRRGDAVGMVPGDATTHEALRSPDAGRPVHRRARTRSRRPGSWRSRARRRRPDAWDRLRAVLLRAARSSLRVVRAPTATSLGPSRRSRSPNDGRRAGDDRTRSGQLLWTESLSGPPSCPVRGGRPGPASCLAGPAAPAESDGLALPAGAQGDDDVGAQIAAQLSWAREVLASRVTDISALSSSRSRSTRCRLTS
jgi:hypothetical protein